MGENGKMEIERKFKIKKLPEQLDCYPKKEMEQGFQGWEYKFNSVSSSRGDYPFITVTAGTAEAYSLPVWI